MLLETCVFPTIASQMSAVKKAFTLQLIKHVMTWQIILALIVNAMCTYISLSHL